MQTKDFAKLQDFVVGETVELGGKSFVVVAIDENNQMHCVRGGRGAEYFVSKYISRKGQDEKNLFYLVSIRGSGAPIRMKNGNVIQAHIFGDLITDAS